MSVKFNNDIFTLSRLDAVKLSVLNKEGVSKVLLSFFKGRKIGLKEYGVMCRTYHATKIFIKMEKEKMLCERSVNSIEPNSNHSNKIVLEVPKATVEQKKAMATIERHFKSKGKEFPKFYNGSIDGFKEKIHQSVEFNVGEKEWIDFFFPDKKPLPSEFISRDTGDGV